VRHLLALTVLVSTFAGQANAYDFADTGLPRHAPPAMRRMWTVRQSGLCVVAIRDAERRYGLPAGTLGAISRVETGLPLPVTGDRQPWPWTINAAGVGHWYASRDAAAAATRSLLVTTHGNVDVGCMQVSMRYHRNDFTSLEDAFDPVRNVDVAARLLSGLARGRSMAAATGLYHSATPALGTPYRDSVTSMRRTQRESLADARASQPR
jgi:hypothetical protein